MELGEVINIATVAGTVVGYLGGQVLEQLHLNRLAQNRQAAVPAHQNLNVYKERLSIARRGVATLALLGAAVGFASGEAATTIVAHEQEPATLAIAVDHTGTTLDGTAHKINAIAEKLNLDPETVHVTTPLVAHSSTAEPVSLKSLPSDKSWGQNIYMANAVQQSLQTASSDSAPVSSNALGSANERAGGVLVLTDGDPIGNVLAEDKTDLPIYIVNVGSKNGANVADLKQDAKLTHGQYFDAGEANPEDIAKEIQASIVPDSITVKSSEGRLPWIVAGLGLLGIEAGLFSYLKRQTVRDTGK